MRPQQLLIPPPGAKLLKRRALSTMLALVDNLPSHLSLLIWRHLSERLFLDGFAAPRWLCAIGPNAGTLGLLHWQHCEGDASVQPPSGAKRLIMALWAQDNPFAFCRPEWAPDLDLPGALPVDS